MFCFKRSVHFVCLLEPCYLPSMTLPSYKYGCFVFLLSHLIYEYIIWNSINFGPKLVHECPSRALVQLQCSFILYHLCRVQNRASTGWKVAWTQQKYWYKVTWIWDVLMGLIIALILMPLCEMGYHLLIDVIIQNNNKSEFSPGSSATIKKQLFQHIQQQPDKNLFFQGY